ncbi:Lipase 3 [Blattella germanica]|nr:Lipase 3 [Blattella germanica]
MVVKNGYPAEAHELVTDDGYILTLHRIPFSPKSPQAPNKPVVLIFHGLLCSSANVVVLGPEKSEGESMSRRR